MVRLYSENVRRYMGTRNALIVGAGAAGRKLAHELKINPSLDFNPIGFADDDPSKNGIKLNGIRVLGSTSSIPQIIAEYQVQSVLIAIPSASSATIQKIVERCKPHRVELKILPPIADRINGNGHLRQVRNVRVEDLLGREPVVLDLDNISRRFQDKVTVITGAGGSIGSEMARQVARFKPRQLILFERSENDLHKIDIELRRRFPALDHVAVVGDILDVSLLREVMAEYRPNSIFHAAAYKHVPMMEKNCFQAVRNNVFGTYNVALVAKQYKVEDFVLISSDKAVNPTNIMGVTKRIAELVLLGLQHQDTRFIAVRFGNVLASNGSVVPLFEEQIDRGGPVTVTHPEAKRYFMTIPEAVQLVLQASVMGRGGEIFVLDMGQPIKIVDLAHNLIRLKGLEPESDIKVVYTGLRPGEKLFEELRLVGEGIKPTPHRKIRVFDGGSPDFQQLLQWLEDLSALVAAKNVHGLVQKLRTIVPEYTPSEELAPLCQIDRHDAAVDYQLAHKSLNVLARDVA
jgi:FlaA1/EpsC-like NDP-sugar epimerase